MATPTEQQIELARLMQVDISGDTAKVAAARLNDVVAPAIYPGSEWRAATDGQIAFGQSLGIDLVSDSFRVASAKIEETLRQRNEVALRDLQLKRGDRVIKRESMEFEGQIHHLEQEYRVSSVDQNLRVWFMGGNGKNAWPTQLERLDASS